MLYSCNHMATVGVKGLADLMQFNDEHALVVWFNICYVQVETENIDDRKRKTKHIIVCQYNNNNSCARSDLRTDKKPLLVRT